MLPFVDLLCDPAKPDGEQEHCRHNEVNRALEHVEAQPQPASAEIGDNQHDNKSDNASRLQDRRVACRLCIVKFAFIAGFYLLFYLLDRLVELVLEIFYTDSIALFEEAVHEGAFSDDIAIVLAEFCYLIGGLGLFLSETDRHRSLRDLQVAFVCQAQQGADDLLPLHLAFAQISDLRRAQFFRRIELLCLHDLRIPSMPSPENESNDCEQKHQPGQNQQRNDACLFLTSEVTLRKNRPDGQSS